MRKFNQHLEFCYVAGQKKWHVIESFIVHTRYGDVGVYQCFWHDRFTFAPDLTDETPAVVHDWLLQKKCFANGTPCSRWRADMVFRDLIVECDAKLKIWRITIPAKVVAPIYWCGVRIGAMFVAIKNWWLDS